MAKLIREFIDHSELEFITEADESSAKKKIWKIRGPYLQAEVKNHNKRTYSRMLIEREVNGLNERKISKGGCPGELDHPNTPVVSWQNACHLIKELHMDGNNAIGLSEILEESPNGRIVICALEHGATPMISSRGVGTIDKYSGAVNENFRLITADIVTDGSAPDSYLEGILENKEFIIGADGEIVEMAVENLQHTVDKRYDSQVKLLALQQFIKDIRKGLK